MLNVGIVTGTYGDRGIWEPLAQRAQQSCIRQTADNWSWSWAHRDTLQSARNDAAAAAVSSKNADWLLFLDADDELDPGYVAAMARAARAVDAPCILRPSVLRIVDGVEAPEPVLMPRTDLREDNYIVIAAMVPASSFLSVGGFDAYPILEDWALWLKLVDTGLRVVDVPEAVYRIHLRAQSRNNDRALHGHVYQQIRARFCP